MGKLILLHLFLKEIMKKVRLWMNNRKEKKRGKKRKIKVKKIRKESKKMVKKVILCLKMRKKLSLLLKMMMMRMKMMILKEENYWNKLQMHFLHLQPTKILLLQWNTACHLKNPLSQLQKNQSQKILLIKVVKQSQKEIKIRIKIKIGIKIRIKIRIRIKKRKKMFHLRKFQKALKKEITEKMTEAENVKVVEKVETEVVIDPVIVEIENIIETGILGEKGMDIEMDLWTDMEIQKKEEEIQEVEEEGIEEWKEK